ncbi:MAG: hypothetical protein ABI164_01435 [Acidobacteriaceae bacterium]
MVNPTPSGDAASPPSSPASPRQDVVYRLYLKLQALAEKQFAGSLAGRLVLCMGFQLSGAELALATTIAGGVFLGIDPNPEALKAAVRNGSCDFMVNTLDEALRVLKNELRKHTPLAAGLLGNVDETLAAIVERGVQPDCIANTTPIQHPPLEMLAANGAQLFTIPEPAVAPHQVTWTAANPQDMRRMDQIALDALAEEDQVRRRWLEQAPGNFHRQTPLQRVIDLLPEERAHLLKAWAANTAARTFQADVEIHWNNT